jgi:hypothetical protein
MSEGFEIVCYMTWCGAEAALPFDNEPALEAAKAFLNGIATLHLRRDQLPSTHYKAAITDYYVIDERGRVPFQNFVRDARSA